jgi:hypothetical protein
METSSKENSTNTLNRDKIAVFLISPQWLAEVLSNGMHVKPTHGIKDITPISIGVDKRTGSFVLCVSSDSIPEYVAFKKCMEQDVPQLVDTPIIDGVEMSGIPVIQASFEKVQ